MDAGYLVADRFEIAERAGAGGMGEVFRARDRVTGAEVAIKVQSGSPEPADDARFEREALALRALDHPGVVRYVAHGPLPSGRRWLAMEWLEGEDLGVRLRRGPLGESETLRLGRRVAEALGSAHARGIVHRDLKPSNLLLPAGDVDRVKVIDFGIARLDWATRATRTGVAVGTPGYMAPEQAQGFAEIDARADVFALGAILFECLTGEPPFVADNLLALLVKILFEDAPRLSQRTPNAPEALDRLLARMLSKTPAERPASGAAVAAALAGDAEIAPRAGEPRGLTEGERRILCVLVVAPPTSSPELDATVRPEDLRPPDEVKEAVLAAGAELRVLPDGGLAVSLAGTGSDQVARAAALALSLRAILPGRALALATGRGSLVRRMPAGEVIDRAIAMLLSRGAGDATRAGEPGDVTRSAEPSVAGAVARGAVTRAAASGDAVRPIDVDHVTAGLLDLRFDVAANGTGFELRGHRDTGDAARTLLGKPTLFVGRDRELRALLGLFEDCAGEPAARAALVTAPAGAGKSRLRQELVQRLGERGEGVVVWTARGDSARTGVPFGLLGELVRRTARLADGEPPRAQKQKILARAGRHFDTATTRRVAEFLGEMVGVPFPDDPSVELLAARRDPSLMGDQMRRAFIDFVGAECERAPLVIILEDLHWADAPSVAYVDAAMRALGERPLMVLALARPEVHDAFPRLWTAHAVTELRLGPLSRKACERIARSVLGDTLADGAALKLWERCEGNAFFLEELVRAVAEGRGGDLPETVLAMLEARLAALDPEDRRVLRAASVFGEVFWASGVRSLLRVTERSSTERLERLALREWIAPRSESRFAGERELTFRHAIVREAVYGMLTPEDRALGHELAGAWLESVGEPFAAVIAEHFERGGATARALPWHRRAAVQAIEGGDPAAALRHVDRAVACGATGAALGDLLVIRAEAHGWRGEHDDSERAARAAIEVLDAERAVRPAADAPAPSEGRWFSAMRAAISAACLRGDVARLREGTAALFESCRRDLPAIREQVMTIASAVGWLFLFGEREEGKRLRAAMEQLVPPFAADPAVMGTVDFYGRAMRAIAEADLFQSYELMASAAAHFERAGDHRRMCKAETSAGMALCDLGGYEEALARFERIVPIAERLNVTSFVVMARSGLAIALARLGRLDEARRAALLAAGVPCGDKRIESDALITLARTRMAAGELAEAEEAARRALDATADAPLRRRLPLALLAEIALASGRVPDALAHAREAVAEMDTREHFELGFSIMRLALAEALDRSGDREGAGRAIASARAELLRRAERIPDVRWRESFLSRVPENARTLALAKAWLGEATEK